MCVLKRQKKKTTDIHIRTFLRRKEKRSERQCRDCGCRLASNRGRKDVDVTWVRQVLRIEEGT